LNKIIEYLEDIISGERQGILPFLVKTDLLAIGGLCLGAVKLRRHLYSQGILQTKHLPCKVISIGNVVVGGSGKTPATIAIARLLKEHTDLKIAIASRGYRSKSKGYAVVSDGEKILLNPDEAGDEPYLIGQSLPDIPVVIGRDRFESGLMAVKNWGTQIVILDDGFQYLRLKRDVNIITMDSTKPFGFEHILPGGYLREPLSTLKNADIILLTRVDQCKNLKAIRDRLDKIAPSVARFESIHAPCSLLRMDTRQDVRLDDVKNQNILAVCGIANPLSFAETLRTLNPARSNLISFPDHHEYTPKDIQKIEQTASDTGADMIITTEKDAPKLNLINILPVLSLAIELRLVKPSAEKLIDIIRQKCNL
jgi:tetraacyldisaccharide 4'-kinase